MKHAAGAAKPGLTWHNGECRTAWDGPRFAPTNRGPDHRHISLSEPERKA